MLPTVGEPPRVKFFGALFVIMVTRRSRHPESEKKFAAVLRLNLSPVLVVDLAKLKDLPQEEIIRISLELGHAIGNQHWPAVVKGTRVFVPLTVDKKVMESVMRTHHIECATCSFQPGSDVIPYLAPHEIRRLFGAAGPDAGVHHHHHHAHPHVHEV